ncbi:MAG: FAD:protein FMN transferase [Pseudomonadota bacterium]
MTTLTTLTRRSFMVMPLALAACKFPNQVIELVGLSMGTTYKVVAIDRTNTLDKATVQEAVAVALTDVNKSMSNWDESSEISVLNASGQGEPLSLSVELADVLRAADHVHAASEGRFDTTVGPLIELWGFGAPGSQAMPSDTAVAAALAKTGQSDSLMLDGTVAQKTRGDAQFYLAGIGKGFGADHVGSALEALGVTDYLVEIGGDLYAAGLNPDGLPWQIGIETPNAHDRGVLGVVGLSGVGLASSGDYRNYFEVDGQRYSHLIDPSTGRPVTHQTASATVLAENAMLADAWSTAMLILGREKGLEVAANHNIAVQFVERDSGTAALQFKTFASEAFDALTA